MKRPAHPCGNCGKPTFTVSDDCYHCRNRPELEEDIELRGDHWITVRGIKHWRPPVAPDAPEPNTTPFEDLIACPVCRVHIWEACRTSSGNLEGSHKARLVPRRCRCGDSLSKLKSQMCDPCGDRARRESKRESSRRIRAARKEAA